MRARERVIRDRFGEQACSHCGALYLPASVVCLAHRPSAWIVMATCPRCERRGIFVVTFPPRAAGDPLIHGGDAPLLPRSAGSFPPALPPQRQRQGPHAEPDPLQPPFSSAPPVLPSPNAPPTADAAPSHDASVSPPASIPAAPVTTADVAAMRDFLADFRGDFGALFAKRRGPRSDDPSA